MDEENLSLKKEVVELRAELEEVKEHLKRYTAPGYKKEYYEKNKEEHIKRVREYQKRTNYKSTWKPSPEEKKISNRRAYLKRKEKLAQEKEMAENIEEV